MAQKFLNKYYTYFFKSYIVIRFPTGLITDDPSGVNIKSPLR